MKRILSPKAFAIANISKMATNGIVTKLPPSSLIIPFSGTSVPLTVVEKGGRVNVGNPDATSPVMANGISDRYRLKRNAVRVPKITTIAFRASAKYLFKAFHF